MIGDWFSKLTGKERKTEARDAKAPARKKLEDLRKMVSDPEARFSVSITLEILNELEAELSEIELQEKPGANLLYLRGHINALYQDWPEAMIHWDALEEHPFGADAWGKDSQSLLAWGRAQRAYQNEQWDEALTGLDARLSVEIEKGNSGLAHLWKLQMMRGWCFVNLKQFDDAEDLARSQLDPGLTDDDALYFYAAEKAEPYRILAAAQKAQGHIQPALQAGLKELAIYEQDDPEEFEHFVVQLLDEAAQNNVWSVAHSAFDKLSSYYDGLEYDHVKDRVLPVLEEWRLKRTNWPSV